MKKLHKTKKQITLVIPPKKPEPPGPVVSTPEPHAPKVAASIAAQIADQLGETRHWPRKQIKQICWALGDDQAQALAQQALEIEDAGGMLVTSGKRRRTPGGIFFHLVYTAGQPREGRELVQPTWPPQRRKKAAGGPGERTEAI